MIDGRRPDQDHRILSDRQLDLFNGGGASTADPPPFAGSAEPGVASGHDDAALIAAVSRASRRDRRGLIGEAVKRQLVDAIPALES